MRLLSLRPVWSVNRRETKGARWPRLQKLALLSTSKARFPEAVLTGMVTENTVVLMLTFPRGEWRERIGRDSGRNAALIGKVDFRVWPEVPEWHELGCIPGKMSRDRNRQGGGHGGASCGPEHAGRTRLSFKQRQVKPTATLIGRRVIFCSFPKPCCVVACLSLPPDSHVGFGTEAPERRGTGDGMQGPVRADQRSKCNTTHVGCSDSDLVPH